MSASIEAQEQPLGQVFGDGQLYKIPSYQRPYCWTNEQVDDLLHDLNSAYSRTQSTLTAGDSSKIEPYFLGSIVLIRSPESSTNEVIDGQQRLTTLTMMFAALRDLSPDPDDHANLSSYVKQTANRMAGHSDSYRLALREQDAEFFASSVQFPGALAALETSQGLEALPESQTNIAENAQAIYAHLSAMSHDDRLSFAEFVIRHCYLVVIRTHNRATATRVFSVMNNRGLDLSPSDALKAEILARMPEDDQADYAARWETVETQLGRLGFEGLLRAILAIKGGLARNSADITSEFRSQIIDKLDSAAIIETLIEHFATGYWAVSGSLFADETEQDFPKINAALASLNRLEHASWRAPAILLVSTFKDQPDVLHEHLLGLERLAYALALSKSGSYTRNKRYQSLLDLISRGQNLGAERLGLGLEASLKQKVLSELRKPFSSSSRLKRPLLYIISELMGDLDHPISYNSLTVEHVLPQNPTRSSTWMKVFPSATARRISTHSLGNMVLVSESLNKQLRNQDFDQKRAQIEKRSAKGKLPAIAQGLVDEQVWDQKAIAQRLDTYVGLLKKAWQL